MVTHLRATERYLQCHMGLHRVTCYPTQVNALGCVHIDASPSMSPGSSLQLMQASPTRVERSRSLVQARNSTLSIDNLQ